ncbi:MAG: hypothetical protein VR70_03510 [Rhodospirillaceae bacterium BRH_c57]|nr:MAG: hypothetical protein VR70_03510 [Rhodospirillaceae bacterium BRH_c57]
MDLEGGHLVNQRHTRTGRWRNTRLVVALPLLALLAVPACAPTAGTGPEVRLTGLRPAIGGLMEPRFLADLRLSNPTGQRMAVNGVTLNLSLGGTLLASGVRNHTLSIAPNADEELTVQARPVSRAVVAHLFGLGAADGLDYAISGEIYRQGRSDSTTPYSAQGTLDLFGGGLTSGEPHYRTRAF